jgi:hypothetical protein
MAGCPDLNQKRHPKLAEIARRDSLVPACAHHAAPATRIVTHVPRTH